MDTEWELRKKLASMFTLISSDKATPERVDAASEKVSEAIGIMTGEIPVPKREESHDRA